MDRRAARACAMKLVYEHEMGGDGGEETLTEILEVKPGEKESDFMHMLYDGVCSNRENLDAEIESRLDSSWKLDRIAKVDHAILLVAAFELMHTDLSDSIIINEAVELGNIYSTEKAGSFINGILGSISRSKASA